MESRAQNDSDGGGGGGGSGSSSAGSSSPSAGLLRTLRDVGRSQPPWPTQDTPPEGSPGATPPPPAPPVLSLDQIRATRNSNEYTEGPMVAPRSPALQPGLAHKASLVILSASVVEQSESQDEGPNNLRNQRSQLSSRLPDIATSAPGRTDGVARSSSSDVSRSSARASTGSASSGQRLLGGPAVDGDEWIIRTQPKHAALKADELKPLSEPAARMGDGGKHAYRCEDCGRCRCAECVRPRALPSCWLCGRRCMCSAQDAVDYGTCVCCVKALFYHCSSDDEDTCTDKPFSCTQSHCCVRWTAVSLLSLFLPCLLCYLPAKGCLALGQSCYDWAARPGCRCRNTNVVHCKSVDKPT